MHDRASELQPSYKSLDLLFFQPLERILSICVIEQSGRIKLISSRVFGCNLAELGSFVVKSIHDFSDTI